MVNALPRKPSMCEKMRKLMCKIALTIDINSYSGVMIINISSHSRSSLMNPFLNQSNIY